MRYLALGDSFTIGTGTTPERAFPAVLARLWGEAGRPCELRDPAVNGYTTDDLIREELPLLAAFRPDLVTLLIGANDLVRALRAGGDIAASDVDRYRAQLARCHERIRADAPRAAVYTLPQPDWSLSPAASAYGDPALVALAIERYNAVAREEADRAGATYVDLFPLMRAQARRGMLAPDGLHPSAEAHTEWARALVDVLRADDAD